MPRERIRLLIVDDSAVTRSVVADALEKDRSIQVVSTAMNVEIARHKIQRDRPDVLLLDMQLPGANGLSLLRTMPVQGLPTVVFTSHAPTNSEAAQEALGAGAVAVIQKPAGDLQEAMTELREAVKSAAKLGRRRAADRDIDRDADERAQTSSPAPVVAPAVARTGSLAYAESVAAQAVIGDGLSAAGTFRDRSAGRIRGSRRLIVIGASTGGTDAIRDVLTALPADSPPVLVVIHMSDVFTSGFARRLNQLCAVQVVEATDGMLLQDGVVLVAPGDRHMVLRQRRDGDYYVALEDGPKVMRHKPSVEVLFQSVAETAASQAMGVMLTGMGGDGATGMLAMRRSGAFTIAQSERSCVVFGMPARAIELGAAEVVLDLDKIANACQHWMRRG